MFPANHNETPTPRRSRPILPRRWRSPVSSTVTLEPGFTPNTGLARGVNVLVRFLLNYILPLLAPFMKYWSTPKRAGRVATKVLIDASGQTGIYYDESGHPMLVPRSCATRNSRTASSLKPEPCCQRFQVESFRRPALP